MAVASWRSPSEIQSLFGTAVGGRRRRYDGYCRVPQSNCDDVAGDCDWDARGLWLNTRDRGSCMDRCRRCGRCSVIAHDRNSSQCEWYASPCNETASNRGVLPRRLVWVKPAAAIGGSQHAWLEPRVGPCSVHSSISSRSSRGLRAASGMGDCEHDEKGSWGVSNMSACIHRCNACSKCIFVSFSAYHQACRWYTACERQQVAAGHALQFITIQAKRPHTDESDGRCQRAILADPEASTAGW